jgi:hypothetical protein
MIDKNEETMSKAAMAFHCNVASEIFSLMASRAGVWMSARDIEEELGWDDGRLRDFLKACVTGADITFTLRDLADIAWLFGCTPRLQIYARIPQVAVDPGQGVMPPDREIEDIQEEVA